MQFSKKYKIPKRVILKNEKGEKVEITLWKKGKSKFLPYRLVQEFGKELAEKMGINDLINLYKPKKIKEQTYEKEKISVPSA